MTKETEIEKIVATAALMLKLDRGEVDTSELERALDGLEGRQIPTAMFASKLTDGKPFSVDTDDDASILEYRAVAQYIGAIETAAEEDNGSTIMLFLPAVRQ